MTRPYHFRRGFIALTSALIMSAVLVLLMYSVSTSTFFARFDALGSQFKRSALGLAESCSNAALLKVSQDYNYDAHFTTHTATNDYGPISYNPSKYGVRISGIDPSDPSVSCYILSASSTINMADPSHPKTYTFVTQAESGGSFSNVTTNAVVRDPSISLVQVAPSCDSFSISPSGTVNAGQAVTLNWNVSNAQSFLLEKLTPTGGTQTLSYSSTTIGTFIDTNTTESATYVGIATGAGNLKSQCAGLSIKVQQSIGQCADTVMVLDRSTSMYTGTCSDGSCIAGEKNAAESLLDLYATVSPTPWVGVARFGDTSGNSADIIAPMTNVYGNRATSTVLGHSLPKAVSSPLVWLNTASLLSKLGASPYATSTTNGQQQSMGNFFGVSTIPAGATINGIEATIDGIATGTFAPLTFNPVAVGSYTPASWVPTPGANTSANKVNVVSDGSNTTYVANSTAISAQTFKLDATAIASALPPGAVINSVTLIVLAQKTSGSPTFALRIEKGTGAGNQADYVPLTTLTSSWLNYSTTSTKSPFSGGRNAWTTADLTNFGFGVNKTSSSGTMQVSKISVLVDYTPASTGAVKVDLSWNNGAVNTWTTGASGLLTVPLTSTDPGVGVTVGGRSSLWGRTSWSAGDFNDGKLVLRLTNNSTTGIITAIDFASLKVYYTQPSTGVYLAIDNGIPVVSPNSYTNLGDAIKVGAAELNRLNDGKKKVMILISDGTNVNRPCSGGGSSCGAQTTSYATSWAQTQSDNAKVPTLPATTTEIFTIHFGDVSGRDLIASLATGTSTVPGHQPGSYNNAGTSNSQSVIDNENLRDGDDFFIAPTPDQIKFIFETIGNRVCPALNTPMTPLAPPNVPPPPLSPASIQIGAWQESGVSPL